MSGAHVAIHAKQQQQKKQKEEEEMTPYTQKELAEQWEFKIVRSTFGAFGKPEKLQDMLAEEALAGWELVEKFDDNRVRLKRPLGARRKDTLLPPEFDPYRTQYDLGEGQLAMVIIGVVGAVALAGVLIAMLVN